MSLSRYCKIYPYREDHDSVILFSTKKASIILLQESMIEDIREGAISEEEKEILVGLGFLVDDVDEEKTGMLSVIEELNTISRTFRAVVVLNLDCNLACAYCFEGTRKGGFYMTLETADLFVDFVKDKINASFPVATLITGCEGGFPEKNIAPFEEIEIVFYGGEPLLSAGLIEYISGRIKIFSDRKGISYSFSLITNGTLLLPKIVERLKPFGFTGAGVTLDGAKEIHDVFRPFRSGKGSFDTIVKNIKDVCDMIEVDIGGNYTQDNYTAFPGLLDYLLGEGLTPGKIPRIMFNPVTRESAEFAPPDFHEGCETINEPWLLDAVIFLREEILRRGYRTQKIIPSVCMVEFRNSLVVNYDGSIYKCPGFIGRERFCVGDLNAGVGDYGFSHNLDSWKNEECLDCVYLPVCFGGCRYMKFVREGNIDGVDCKKIYFDATLGKLVDQDIRYGLKVGGY
ncbi:MAG: geopeptide radical SAM maturase [Nitrospirota bacterium]|nr:geopeptide radical SAM maturase [Nitrospirota bacterium]